jgi:hypothetical protein
MGDQTDVLIQLWLSRWEQIRHSETQRSTITNMILVLSAAGLGLVFQKGLRAEMLVVSGSITLLGMFGCLVSIKYYERFTFHLREAAALRRRLDEKYPELALATLADEVSKEQILHFKVVARVPLYRLWMTLHGGIVAVGLLVSAIIVVRTR